MRWLEGNSSVTHDRDSLISTILYFPQSLTPLLTRLRRFTADTADDDIYVPRNFIESVQNNTKFEQLKDDNEWLQRIDKELSDSDLSILRHAFLMDGHNFMNTLSQFLHTVKWQEFFARTYMYTGSFQNAHPDTHAPDGLA